MRKEISKMDQNGKSKKRKGSWDSKMSISTVSTRHIARSDTPSSIISSDSDIRFTRKRGHYRCGCCVAASVLFFLLVVGTGAFFGYTFWVLEPAEDQIFLATFRVVQGDAFRRELADPITEPFKRRARDYREMINLVFRRSVLRPSFIGTDVLALDGVEGQDLIVHFNLHFDPRRQEVRTTDILTVLSNEILLEESRYLGNLTIDPKSLEIQENSAALRRQDSTSKTPEITTLGSTKAPSPPRRCVPVQLSYCSKLPYNITSYPNHLGHKSLEELKEDVIAFRELVDAECYRLAYEFVCQVLQPACRHRSLGEPEDRSVLPCRSFCADFHAGCGSRIPERFKDALDCKKFPEYTEPGSCTSKPGCVKELQSRALTSHVCDGVVDCPDLSDEMECTYCPPGHMHCGRDTICISPEKRCDGKQDCPNGSDERGCLTVAPSIAAMTRGVHLTPHQSRYYSEGYVVFNEKGQSGKLCTENINSTIPEPNREAVLHTVASSLCSVLSYQSVNFVSVQRDTEEEVRYVHMEDPTASEITFVRAPCPKKEVLYVGCNDLECGRQTLRGRVGLQGLNKMAAHGDWPWHTALFKDGVHVCDGTLVSSEWLLTTASCFQGQPKAQWIARLGSIRLSGASPWQQERSVVGMVKSPVEGSTIVMVKLEQPVTFSDFVHAICLPQVKVALHNLTYCNTLGWARNRDELQRVELKFSAMPKCENISIPTVNSICTESSFHNDDCTEEEFAGSPMMCLQSDKVTWSLVGVGNWRIACSKLGVERPRMYDKMSSNIEWIQKTMKAIP